MVLKTSKSLKSAPEGREFFWDENILVSWKNIKKHWLNHSFLFQSIVAFFFFNNGIVIMDDWSSQYDSRTCMYSMFPIKWEPILLKNSKKFWKIFPFCRIPILSRISCKEIWCSFFKKNKENAYYLLYFRVFSEKMFPFLRIPILSGKSCSLKNAQIPILSNSHFIGNVL